MDVWEIFSHVFKENTNKFFFFLIFIKKIKKKLKKFGSWKMSEESKIEFEEKSFYTVSQGKWSKQNFLLKRKIFKKNFSVSISSF